MKQKVKLALVVFLVSTPARSQGLSFDDALAKLSHSVQDEKLDEANLDEAKARQRTSWQVYLPEVSATAARHRVQDVDQPSTDADLNLGLNLYRSGADRAASQAGSLAGELASRRHSAARMTREYAAAKLLLDLVYAQKLKDIESQFLTISTKNLDLTQKLYQRGLKSSQDTAMLQIDLAKQQAQVSSRDRSVMDAVSKIKSRTAGAALPVSESWSVDWPWKQVLASKSAPLFQGETPAQSLPKTLAELEKRDAELTYRRVLASGMPTLDLNWNYHWERVSPDVDPNRVWRASLQVTVPIFQRGLNAAERAGAYARVVETENSLADTELRVSTELTRLRHKMNQLADQLRLRGDTIQLARNLYDQALLGYQRGVKSVNDLNLDQSRFLDSERLAAEDWYEVHLTMVALCEAIEQPLRGCLR